VLTRDGILNSTAEFFFHNLRDDTDFLSLVAILASALEFTAILGGKRKLSKKERKERQAKVDELDAKLDVLKAEQGVEDGVSQKAESKVVPTSAVARRANALLWAHLLRVEPEDPELKSGE
jgi:translocation protein SEC63